MHVHRSRFDMDIMTPDRIQQFLAQSMTPLLNSGSAKQIEQIASAEFGGDVQQRLQHIGRDGLLLVQPATRQLFGFLDQILLLSGAGHEGNQLLAKQARVVGIAGLGQPA